jgi:hypothetical protein
MSTIERYTAADVQSALDNATYWYWRMVGRNNDGSPMRHDPVTYLPYHVRQYEAWRAIAIERAGSVGT